ncbi:MAG: glycosyltransferase family 4 protein [Gammaproteobacteria bacterium]|nr:glycosyltransferase family 4 protein [Gammaproteobacteria bacterium]
MNILYVHQYAMKPEQAGLSRAFDYSRALVSRGNTVTLLAGSHDHFAGHDPHLQADEDGRRERVEGVEFQWLKTPAYRGNTLGRIRNMLNFMWQVARLRPDRVPDVVIGSSPSLFAAVGAWWLSRRLQRPFVLEIRDLWPDSLIDLGGYSRLDPRILAFRLLEKLLYRRAQLVVSALPGSERHINAVARRECPFAWVPNALYRLPELAEPAPRDGNFVLMYSGTHGLANHLDALLDAAACLQQQGVDDIEIRLIGQGPERERLQRRATDEGLQNVHFLPAVPKAEIYDVLAEADAFVILFKDVPVYRYGVSANKIFDYLAMSRPVLFGSEARYHPERDCDACLRVPSEHPEAIAAAIRDLRDRSGEERAALGRAGREYVQAEFLVEHHAARLEKALAGVLRNEKADRA